MVELLQLVELLEMHRAHVVQVVNISVATEQLRFRKVSASKSANYLYLESIREHS
jgi:hypothetical protein